MLIVPITVAAAVTMGVGVPIGIPAGKNTLILPARMGKEPSQGMQPVVSVKQTNVVGQVILALII